MAIYESAEDYLERILMLNKKNQSVRSIDLANSMNYAKASISRAIKNLRENKYILVDSKGIITLTESGMEIAERMLERHNFLTEFFTTLGVDKETAWKDACKIEHDLSIETFTALKKFIEEKSKK